MLRFVKNCSEMVPFTLLCPKQCPNRAKMKIGILSSKHSVKLFFDSGRLGRARLQNTLQLDSALNTEYASEHKYTNETLYSH